MFKGLLCGAVLLGAAACSDDHFDINDGGEFSATRTIWQNIQSEPQLSDLAAILQRVPVYKSVSDKKSSVLYSTLLDQPQSFTMWAPKNGSYDAQSYLNRLDEAEAIADDSLRAVAKFRVGYQFVMNHLARFNYESNAGEQEVFLLNSKRASYNSAARTFNNIPLLQGYESIPSSNGTLHILDGYSPFLKNMMENITEDYSAIRDVLYLQKTDDSYVYQINSLDAGRSVEGAMDNRGNMVYVDTVWSSYNTLTNATGALLANEDSTYVAVIPATDAAWQTAVDKLIPLFNYGSLYWTKWDDESGAYAKQATNGLVISAEAADSLARDRAYRRLFQSMYITPSDCGFNTEESIDSAELINYVLTADTLLTTQNYVYRNPNPGGVNPIFEGKKPRRLSNGYVFELDQADIDPSLIWAPRIDFSPYAGRNVLKTENCTDAKGESVYLMESDRNPLITGFLQDDHYQRFQVSSGAMKIFIKLPDVLSGSYRLKLTMAPNYTRLDDAKFIEVPVVDEETGEPVLDPETGEPVVEEVPDEVISRFVADVYYDTHRQNVANDPANRVNATQATVVVDQDAIKEYVVFDKLTFNKCFYGLPTDDDSAPYLVIELSTRNQSVSGKNNNALNIVRVILEPLAEGE